LIFIEHAHKLLYAEMITTNDALLYRKLTLLRSHGITKGNFEFPGVSEADDSLINKNEAWTMCFDNMH
jgi:dTDP-4-amino-4,6-dideoxygalactose transaminase